MIEIAKVEKNYLKITIQTKKFVPLPPFLIHKKGMNDSPTILSFFKALHSRLQKNRALRCKISLTIALIVLNVWATQAQNDDSATERQLLETKATQEQTIGKNHPNYAVTLNNLGGLYYKTGDYAQAEHYYIETKLIQEQTIGKAHPDYATTLNNLGAVYYKMGDYTKMEACYLEAKNIQERTLGKEHPSNISILNNLGLMYQNMGDYAKAEQFYSETKQIQEQTIGKEHPNYAITLNNLGSLYQITGDYAKAEQYYLETKRIRETTLGKEHISYISILNNLGSLYQNMGNYTQAELYYDEAKQIKEQTDKQAHPDYAITLNHRGALYYKQGNYAQAEQLYLEAKQIQERTLGTAHPDYAVTLNHLGGLYYKIGDYTKAEQYYLYAKQIKDKTLDKEHPDYATTLNDLGGLYYKIGDYTKAEQYYLETKNIQEKTLGKNHPDYAIILNNLGGLYYKIGDYAKMEQYYLDAKNIREKTLGKEHPSYVTILGNLGLMYQNKGDYLQAEQYYLETKTIQERTLGKAHPDYAVTLNNLGSLYQNMGDNSQAEQYYLEVRSIREKTLGKDHSDYAVTLNTLGEFYQNRGDYLTAEKYYLEAKTIQERTLGKSHPDYATTLNNLGELYKRLGIYTKAIQYMQEVCAIISYNMNQNFSFMSETQRNQYWNTQEKTFITAYSLSHFSSLSQANDMNYNNALFTKGLLLRTSNDIRDAIYSSGNPQLIGQYEQLGELRKEIGVLQQKTDYQKEYVETLQARADSLDKAITFASSAYRNMKADLSMTWQNVQKQLQANEAAIEFVHFRLYDRGWTHRTIYAVMVLRPETADPVWIPLCEQQELQAVLHAESADMQTQTETLYTDKGRKLYQLTWQAIEKELSGVKTVYYSPSGLLHKIAFAALPMDDNIETRYATSLLSDKYNLQLVSSTREIARLKQETADRAPQDTTVVYGGLTYDLKQTEMIAEAKRYQSSDSQHSRFIDRFLKRDAELPDSTLRGGFAEWKYLTGTKAETEQIVASLKTHRIPHEYYTESKGNEESFKHLTGTQTGVIHLATHGFFLPDVENKAVEDIVQRLGGSKEKPFDNPLLRSGLIMSGANNQWLAKEYIMEDGIEDGILTSDEISRLNLTKTKLVVLSACETGLGDVKNSEGVFGLQRAFKLAGVESLIMSLWKVPDDATSELMTTFYQEWLNGNPKQQAFKIARQKVREKYVSPYYWAAFVMMD